MREWILNYLEQKYLFLIMYDKCFVKQKYEQRIKKIWIFYLNGSNGIYSL
jgi:hypothetical protein